MKTKLEDLDYIELKDLYAKIFQLPSFVINDESKKEWAIKIKKLQTKILDDFEIINGVDRKYKVRKYIEFHPEFILEDDFVRFVGADRRPFGESLEEFYFDYRYEIETLFEKIRRCAPLTKEEVEYLAEKDIQKYNL